MDDIREEINRLSAVIATEGMPREQLLQALDALRQISLGLVDLTDEVGDATTDKLAAAV
jgi:hypothetical protein